MMQLHELSRFVSIDFETATAAHSSACAIAVVRVEDEDITVIVNEVLRTNVRNFDFAALHGITEERSRHGREFSEVWTRIEEALNLTDNRVVAHNATFDRRVLQSCLRRSRIRSPRLRFFCSMHIAQATWGFSPSTLTAVCEKLGIELRHHDPLSDAMAAAQIVIRARKERFLRSASGEPA